MGLAVGAAEGAGVVGKLVGASVAFGMVGNNESVGDVDGREEGVEVSMCSVGLGVGDDVFGAGATPPCPPPRVGLSVDDVGLSVGSDDVGRGSCDGAVVVGLYVGAKESGMMLSAVGTTVDCRLAAVGAAEGMEGLADFSTRVGEPE